MSNYRPSYPIIRFVILFIASVQFFSATVLAEEFPSTPHATIEHVSTVLLAELPELSAAYDDSTENFYQGIDRLVSPWIDYESFYKGVMGREYYTAATPEQRAKFKTVFQQSLIETYGKGLLGISETRFEVAPPKEDQQSGNSVPVQQTLYSDNGRVVVVYTMGQADTGRWRLKNVILEGINLGKTFRNQFSRSAREYSDDLDKVITSWSSGI